ncbi:pseudouridine synthase [Microcella sp.]|uniref:pseudouridine synthase n=1 Tax=Microcella sp. TaxID=1913979 RepID=UPI003919F815
MTSDNGDARGGSFEIPPWDDAAAPTGERLQKVMAAAGVASRRVSEQYIEAGRVTVNGEVVTELGRRIDPETDEIAVDGVAIQLDQTKRYLMLNKPRGVVSTMKDEQGRPDLRQYADRFEERVYNVGRLDTDTSGLLLLTNDGELANVLAHPKFGVEKTYIAKVRGVVAPKTLTQLKTGVELEDGPIHADAVKVIGSPQHGHTMVELTLHSGRNRIVRRMMAEVGHPVVDLVRRQFGPLHLGPLKLGAVRELTTVERGALLTLARAARDGVDTGSTADARPAKKPTTRRPRSHRGTR